MPQNYHHKSGKSSASFADAAQAETNHHDYERDTDEEDDAEFEAALYASEGFKNYKELANEDPEERTLSDAPWPEGNVEKGKGDAQGEQQRQRRESESSSPLHAHPQHPIPEQQPRVNGSRNPQKRSARESSSEDERNKDGTRAKTRKVTNRSTDGREDRHQAPEVPASSGQGSSPPPELSIPKTTDAEWARYIQLRETASLCDAQQQNEYDLSAINTKKEYAKYRAHWDDWCTRKKFANNIVYKYKFVLYMTENLMFDTRGDNSIQPLRKAKKKSDAKPSPTGNYVMPETAHFYVKAAVELWNEQSKLMPDGVIPGSSESPRCWDVRKLIEAYQNQIESLIKASESRDSGEKDRYGPRGFKRMMKSFWTRNYMQLSKRRRPALLGLRDRLNLSWTHFMMCRGEDMRMALLKDLQCCSLEFSDLKGQFALGVVLTMQQRKANADGLMQCSLAIRNKDVEICPIGSLAFYVFELFLAPRSPPDFSDSAWESIHLVFARDQQREMSSTTHYNAQKEGMRIANIQSTKVTQGGRRAVAQHAPPVGVTIDVIAHHGNWIHQRLSTPYLSEIPHHVPLKLAGFTSHQEQPLLSRNALLPPLELQRLIFPFIEEQYPGNKDWATWMDNIMLDKDECENRKLEPQLLNSMYPASDITKRTFLILLAHLRRVVLQDAAALMAINEEPLWQYSQHHIFKEPVFRGPLFKEFRVALDGIIANPTLPVVDNRHTNTIAIQQELQKLNNAVAGLAEMVKSPSWKADIQQEQESRAASIEAQMKSMESNIIRLNNSLAAFSINVNESRQSLLNELPQSSSTEGQFQDSALARLPSLETLSQSQEPVPQQGLSDVQQVQQPSLQPTMEQLCSTYQLQPQSSATKGPPMRARQVDYSLKILAEQIANPRTTPTSTTFSFDRLPRGQASIRQVWEEWLHGVDGGPSIWQMNRFCKGWRKDEGVNERKAYSYKWHLVYSVLQAVSQAPEKSLAERIESGLATIEERIARAGSLEQYYMEIDKPRIVQSLM